MPLNELPLEFYPVTPDRWEHLEALFGRGDEASRCWCMWWRLSPRDYDHGIAANRRRALQALVGAGRPPGLLAYAQGRPIGWCSVAPREQFLRLRTAATWRPIDSQPVWSIVCYYIAPDFRQRRVATELLVAAVAYARDQGAEVIEAYPKDTSVQPGRAKDKSLYFGTATMYRAAGFREVARRNPAFPIMRLKL